MLTITIPGGEYFDERKQEFFTTKDFSLVLEHSLVSLSKWEANWKKPFLSREPKNLEETIDYVKCMTLTQNVPDYIYLNITNDIMKEINQYIDAPMTATTFSKERNGPKSREIITAEIIYYWMIAYNIPLECQKWHLNRLLTLVKVCNIKNTPAKKMGKKDLYSRNAALNAARKKQYNTRG